MKCVVKLVCFVILFSMVSTLFIACSKVDEVEENSTLQAETISLESEEQKEEEFEENNRITIKPSPDKYTWYVKNYVGKNCASVGYGSLGGERLDEYGAGHLKVIFVSADGIYVDYSSEDVLKEWVVTGQNLDPNTEIKYEFKKDENGEEYDSWVSRQSYEEIVLSVKKIGTSGGKQIELTKINPSLDKSTYYISDYVGRNLANCGYVSMGGDFLVEYGETTLKFVIVTDDGTYVDFKDKEILKQYVVKGQNIEPNTELKLVFRKYLEEEDFEWVDSQNIDEIELYVKKIK